MFALGELVVYGGEGVCRVERIGTLEIPGADKTRLYYTLLPLYRTGQVLTPVDTRVLMRSALTAEQARELMDSLDQLEPEEGPTGNLRLMKEHCQSVLASYDCAALARFIRAAAGRRRRALEQGKKPSQMDERYLNQAEDRLYGELGAALGLDRGAVADRIRETHPRWPEM